MIRIYNSLTGQKEELKPVVPDQVGMYVCGPTVYDFPHIGNARPVVVFDVLYRLLRRIYGEKHVTYVRNITDVDDKINEAAKKNGEPISALTARVAAEFHRDMDALGNLSPTYEPRATAHIPEMIGMIERLIENKHAYLSEGHVLFSVKTDPQYGVLSRRKLEDLIAGARVEVEAYKKDPGDFVLWKPANPNDDPSSIFESPWGPGRPGWHIECSAMSTKYLNRNFDIHGGGADLKFPHHENEIAQSTCAHKGSHYAKYWMHNGFVTVNGEKMAKSLGNFITVRDLLDKWPGEVIRLLLLKTHYRAPLDFTEEGLRQAKKELDRWYAALRKLSDVEAQIGEDFADPIGAALSDDLNTPLAVAELHRISDLIYSSQDLEEGGTKDSGVETFSDETKQFVNRGKLKHRLVEAGKQMGLLYQDPEAWFHRQPADTAIDESKIESLIAARVAARKAKNFKESDRIRDELAAAGVILEDGPQGTTWRRK